MIECDGLRCKCDVQTETFGINRNQNHIRNQSHSPQQQSLIRRHLIRKRVHTLPQLFLHFMIHKRSARHIITMNK